MVLDPAAGLLQPTIFKVSQRNKYRGGHGATHGCLSGLCDEFSTDRKIVCAQLNRIAYLRIILYHECLLNKNFLLPSELFIGIVWEGFQVSIEWEVTC